MQELRNRWAAEKRRLSYLSDEVNGITDGDTVKNLECSLCEVWKKILWLLNSFAEVATCEEFEEVLKDFNGLELMYVSAKTRLAGALQPEESVKINLSRRRVTLPTFNGGYLSWIQFRRIFRSCVVENNEYQDYEKLDLLKKLVTGHPRAIIQHEEDFSRCWDLLHQMYHNRREIANALAQEILKLPKVFGKQENKTSAEVVNSFREIYSGFIELNMFDLWDVLTTNMITECLKEDVVSLWRATLPDGFIPPLDNLLQFLDHHVLNNSKFGQKS